VRGNEIVTRLRACCGGWKVSVGIGENYNEPGAQLPRSN
jgi:hypothetical protein